MTSKVGSPTSPDDSVDAFEKFSAAHPDAYRRLVVAGYEFAGKDVFGRCHRFAVLFLRLYPSEGAAEAWAYDTKSKTFVGATFRVVGPLDAALGRAQELAESSYEEDQLSGTCERRSTKLVDCSFSP